LRNAEIQDRFWRELFVSFIKPLTPLYEDPLSAGAHVLSAYLANPHDAAREFGLHPEAFGELREGAPKERAGAIYRDLLTGKHGATRALCRRRFREQRIASAEIAQFADEQPTAFRRLQKERALRNAKPATAKVRVQLLGRSFYVAAVARQSKRRYFTVQFATK
jgi:hypothetical protein